MNLAPIVTRLQAILDPEFISGNTRNVTQTACAKRSISRLQTTTAFDVSIGFTSSFSLTREAESRLGN